MKSKLFYVFYALCVLLLSSCATKPPLDVPPPPPEVPVVEPEVVHKFVPVDSTNIGIVVNLIAKFPGKVQLYTDSFSIARPLPDDLSIVKGQILRKTNLMDAFAAKSKHPVKPTRVDLAKKETVVSFRDSLSQERSITFKDIGDGYVLFSSELGDTIRSSSNLIYPSSYGKNIARLYIDMKDEIVKPQVKVFKEDKVE